MGRNRRLFRAFSKRRDLQSGVTTVEYAIMLILIAISVAGFGLGLNGSVTSVFSRMSRANSTYQPWTSRESFWW